jgi:hypothetical protein
MRTNGNAAPKRTSPLPTVTHLPAIPLKIFRHVGGADAAFPVSRHRIVDEGRIGQIQRGRDVIGVDVGVERIEQLQPEFGDGRQIARPWWKRRF